MESLILGNDSAVLSEMIPFYVQDETLICDITANERRMWRAVSEEIVKRVTYCDIDPAVKPDHVCDWASLPFKNEQFGAVIFDPPHLPIAAASPKSMQQFAHDYGLHRSVHADNPTQMFPSALKEAYRVLIPDGVLIAKIKDYVHNHKYQWNLFTLNQMALEAGFTCCDLIIKRDPAGGKLKSGRWKNSHHARNVHCYFPVYRKGRCEPKKKKAIVEEVEESVQPVTKIQDLNVF